MGSFIPVVNLASPRDNLLTEIKHACQCDFFQIVNHGTPSDVMEKMLSLSEAFFALPAGYKTCCTTDAGVAGPIHFGPGSKGDWRDVLKLNLAPESHVAQNCWPTYPLGFKETLIAYASQQKHLAMTLLHIISESLGLDSEYITNETSDPRIVMAINHSPPCHDPSSNIGITEHSDPCTITIMLQDSVSGLQVYKDGEWLDVKPVEGALVINVGDHLQLLSNNKYSSCLHRMTVNKAMKKTSIEFLLSPALTTTIKPAPALLDDETPVYRELTYGDFLKDFYKNGGPNKKAVPSEFESEDGK